MRTRFPDLEVPRPWRLAVLIVVGIGLAALAAWWAGMGDEDGLPVHSSTLAPVPVDPLVAEFRRCQSLGDAGAHDAGCLAAWAENRRRFLGLDRRPAAVNPQVAPAAPATSALSGAR